MDENELNSNPTDEIVPPQETQAIKTYDELETNEDRIEWLSKNLMTTRDQLAALQDQVTEFQANPIPTPETIAQSAATILEPEIKAMKEAMQQLQESAQSTPPMPNPGVTDTNPMGVPVESPEENPDPIPPSEPEPQERKHRIRKV